MEGDFDWTGIRANTSGAITVTGAPVPGTTDSLSRNVNWLSTIRGRVGYTMSDWLFYATGGAAWGRLSESANQTALGLITWGPFTTSSTRNGWVTGAGVEHALNKNWILRAEYLFYSLSGLSGFGTGSLPGTGIFVDSFGRTNIQTIRAGMSYEFN
jgi:outer membrane immunogenic protein